MTRLVLGSASTGRLTVLRHAGVEPIVIVSAVDEDAVIAAHPGVGPANVVSALAAAKANDVAHRLPSEVATDCVVIGCDSMLFLGDTLRGKPGTADNARLQWRDMAGKTGNLWTGHTVLRVRNGNVTLSQTESSFTAVHFSSPASDDLDAYIASGEPLGVAGSFTLDGLGGWFVDRIEGAPSNVIGLDLPLLRRMLDHAGVSVAAVWEANRVAQ